MSNTSSAGMTAWVGMAVQAVGAMGDRAYDAWLAEVERTAVDLWLMSAPGGSTARLAADLSSCTPVNGVLAHAHVDGDRGRARLVVRTVNGEGVSEERSFHTEELTRRRARDVLERAQSLVGHGVRLLLTASGSGEQRVLHISDSGERERGSAGMRAERTARDHAAAVPEAVAPVAAAPAPASTAPAPDPAPQPVSAPAPVPPRAPAPVVPAEAPAPPPAGGVTWEEGSLSVWRNINRGWPKAYRTSCLLALRDRVMVDDKGVVLNLDELIALAQESPDPDTPRGKDIAARYPA
ncbi:hypothetical protein [Streptomyces sp. NPDC007264]|uniref:hypothetical protein n=1 Tax=Streptomyces sp. NPDC007264 TaxID=3364777 RepID=UPI0036D97AE3